jgi:hypothetical protein
LYIFQEKELKTFREGLKQEVKLLKHEIDLLPKDRRKEEFKHRKENLERDQKRRVIFVKSFFYLFTIKIKLFGELITVTV